MTEEPESTALKIFQYLYALVWNVFVLVGTAYLVVKFGFSAWLFLPAVLILLAVRNQCKCKEDKK